MDLASRASVGGAFMSDIHIDIIVIFQKQNSKSMLQQPWKPKKQNFLCTDQAVWYPLQKTPAKIPYICQLNVASLNMWGTALHLGPSGVFLNPKLSKICFQFNTAAQYNLVLKHQHFFHVFGSEREQTWEKIDASKHFSEHVRCPFDCDINH